MDTVGGIVRSALRKAGVLAAGEPLSPDDGGDALEAFVLMVDGWTNESLLIPVLSTLEVPLIPGQSEYTFGEVTGTPPNNHVQTPRPERIITAFIRDRYNTDYIQEIIDTETFARISRKGNESRPSRFYYRKSWPLNTIFFESTPYADEVLHLEVIQPLSGVLPAASLQEVISLPPGYKRALIYNLAIEISDEYGKAVTPATATIAAESKKWLKRNNYRTLVLGMDRAAVTNRKGLGTYIIEQGP